MNTVKFGLLVYLEGLFQFINQEHSKMEYIYKPENVSLVKDENVCIACNFFFFLQENNYPEIESVVKLLKIWEIWISRYPNENDKWFLKMQYINLLANISYDRSIRKKKKSNRTKMFPFDGFCLIGDYWFPSQLQEAVFFSQNLNLLNY